ncbi:DUF805 domain-containing protein [Candidatus Roizmanbacteria bacterium]|nr:DUF805 domain-containing protein [Candidatus Roizmanbacteria bacterium]
MHWYFEVLKKYTVFNGRARRKEYWYFSLFNIIVIIVLIFINAVIDPAGFRQGAGFGPLSSMYVLVTLIPGIAVSVRRLHDTDRSGWWLLIGFIPLASIVLLVFMVQDSTPGENKFGSNPKESTLNAGAAEGPTKKCPDCAELIRLDATKCRYCGKVFDPPVSAQQDL